MHARSEQEPDPRPTPDDVPPTPPDEPTPPPVQDPPSEPVEAPYIVREPGVDPRIERGGGSTTDDADRTRKDET